MVGVDGGDVRRVARVLYGDAAIRLKGWFAAFLAGLTGDASEDEQGAGAVAREALLGVVAPIGGLNGVNLLEAVSRVDVAFSVGEAVERILSLGFPVLQRCAWGGEAVSFGDWDQLRGEVGGSVFLGELAGAEFATAGTEGTEADGEGSEEGDGEEEEEDGEEAEGD